VFARFIARLISGADTRAKPDGSPRLRSVIRVTPAPAVNAAITTTPRTGSAMARVPDGVERQGGHVERDAVEDDGRPLAVAVAQRPGEDGRGEREERHDHQQQGVQEQHRAVGAADVVEHHVVVG